MPAVFKEMHAARGRQYTFALLDCNKKLNAPPESWTKAEKKAAEDTAAASQETDGKAAALPPIRKSIFEIFRINRKIKPTVFFTAPWTHPQRGGPGAAKQVPDGQLSDSTTMRKYLDTALRPRAPTASTNAELARVCGWGKHAPAFADGVGGTCVALIKGKRHGKEHLELEEKLIREFPLNRYVSVPASKQSVRLSLNTADAEAPSDSYALQIHALRNNSHYLTMSTPVSWEFLKTFVSRAASAPLEDFSAAGPEGITFDVGEKSSSFKKRAPTPPSYAERASDSSSAAAATPAEAAAAAKAAKERRAREEMDRQASEANMEGVGDGDEDEEEGEDEDEGEEDMVEL